MIDEDLLKILGCPLDENRPPLHLEGEWLICTQCGAKFPIENGIPNLLPESAILPEINGAKNG